MINAISPEQMQQLAAARVAVVIPSYRARQYILQVLAKIPTYIWRVIVVDDQCPEQTGSFVQQQCTDSRVHVVVRPQNGGVGAAMVTGYQTALNMGAQVVVKIDSDDQMPSELMHHFVLPILQGRADYTKGNRFFDAQSVSQMPPVRLFGNLCLSFLTKLSSGYWNLFDPTNGYTAIHTKLLAALPLDKLSPRYFFESDLLFRLGIMRAKVLDIPMRAEYPHDSSSLSIGKIVGPFLKGHLRNTFKRVVYNYYLRDFSIASLMLPLGLGLILFGVLFGTTAWIRSDAYHQFASAGTVMLAALPVILGTQFILSFVLLDMQSTPTQAIANDLDFAVLKDSPAPSDVAQSHSATHSSTPAPTPTPTQP